MELSLFLAQVLGVYFVIAGIVAIARRKSFMSLIAGMKEQKLLIIVIAAFELVAGLALAFGHPVFTFDYRGVITLIGWWMIIEGVAYFALPFRSLEKLIRYFNRSSWYLGGGAVAVLMGAYLALAGFGFIA